jgi:hypothetical protein
MREKIYNFERIPGVLLSGIFLGVAIFTKVPIFVTISLIAFLNFTNGNRSLKSLDLVCSRNPNTSDLAVIQCNSWSF